MIIPSRPRAFVLTLAAVAAVGGALVAIHYSRLGLTLSHYDARGHLVVARRIVDSLTPGWQQIGAVWLPLPHLLNAIPVQSDVMYRTGASAVAISVGSFAVAVGALAWLIGRITESRWAAVAGAAPFALNPNVLYLQATPMTEPLLIALSLLGVAMITEWCARFHVSPVPAPGRGTPESARLLILRRWFSPRKGHQGHPGTVYEAAREAPGATPIGIVLALACLTRYEAWPVTASALALAWLALTRTGLSSREALSRVGRIARYPIGAILAFSLFSRVVIGEWFVSGGFFVPENAAIGRPLAALAQVGRGILELSGAGLLAGGAAGLVGLVLMATIDRSRAWVIVPISLAATAALPLVAFFRGHPFRIRYMVALIAAQAIGIGVAAGLVRRARPAMAAALLALAVFELRPLDADARMVVEAQWDRPGAAGRQQVTDCLRRNYSGEAIMASMGSLGHYMQALAHAGLDISDFLHEGNGDVWLAALEHPRPYAGWILIEEKAEGGDRLAALAMANPQFLDGFSRVCEGAGVALYLRTSP